MKTYIDRRNSARLRMPPMKVGLATGKSTDLVYSVVVRDISAGGLGMQSDFPMRKGQRFKIQIRYPSGLRGKNIRSRVIWCQIAWSKPLGLKKKSRQFGIKFLNYPQQISENVFFKKAKRIKK